MKFKKIFTIGNIFILSTFIIGCEYVNLENNNNVNAFKENNSKNTEIAMFNEELVDQNQEVVKINKAIITFEKVHELLFSMDLKDKENINKTKEYLKPLLHESIQKNIINKLDEVLKTNYNKIRYNGIEIKEMNDIDGFKIDGKEKKAFYITYSIKSPQIDNIYIDKIKSTGIVVVEDNNEFKVASFLGI